MRAVIDYCLQPHKTETEENLFATSGQHCAPDFAYKEFMTNKAVWHKTDGLCFRHYIQSFHPSENISPDEANKIGLEFAQKAWAGYGVLVSTHVDREHIHNHFVIDTVNVESGRKLHENRNNIENLRLINDGICQSHGLSVLPSYAKKGGAKSISSREYRAGIKRDSWKFRLRAAINTAMEVSFTKAEFIAVMESLGYGVRWQDNRKNITYTCFREPQYKNGAYRKCNDDKLADEKYLKENMENEFRIRQEILAGRDYGNEPTDSQNGADSRGRMGRNNLHPGADADFDRRNMSGEESNGIGGEGAQGNGEKFAFEADRNLRQTGWESKREGCFKNRTAKDYGRPFMGASVGAHGNTHGSGLGLGGLYGLVPLIDNDGKKTPEEIEAEERARIAASNAGAIIGAGILIAEALTDQDDPDEDDGFTIKM